MRSRGQQDDQKQYKKGSTGSCCSLSRVLPSATSWTTPGFPVLHYLLNFAQTHVHWFSNAIQPSHPLSSHSPPAFNLSQHQGKESAPFSRSRLFASGGQSSGASERTLTANLWASLLREWVSSAWLEHSTCLEGMKREKAGATGRDVAEQGGKDQRIKRYKNWDKDLVKSKSSAGPWEIV